MSAGRANQLIEAGLWLRLSGDHEGAKRLFEQALRMDPGNSRADRLLHDAPSGTFDVSELPQELKGAAPGVASQPSASAPLQGSPGAAFPPPPAFSPPPNAFAPPPPAFSPPAHRASAGAPPPPAVFPPPPPPAFRPAPQPMRGVTEPLPRTEITEPNDDLAPDANTGWDLESSPSTNIPAPAHADPPNPMDWAVDSSSSSAPVEDSAVRREEVRTLLQGAQELIELDDHSGALELILKAERIAPGDPSVRALRDRSERTLQSMYESKLGNLQSAPRVKLKDDEIIWLNLDHRAGFVLAQIDGGVSFEDVFAVSGMSRLDTARILVQLLDEGVIGL